jgi:hypothetical protein
LLHSIVWVAVALAAATSLMVMVSVVVATILAARSDAVRAAAGEVSRGDASTPVGCAHPSGSEPELEDALWPEIDVLAAETARKRERVPSSVSV